MNFKNEQQASAERNENAMTALTDFAYSFLLLCISCGVLVFLAPGKSTEGYVKYVAALAVIAALASNIPHISNISENAIRFSDALSASYEEKEDYEDNAYRYFTDTCSELICTDIERAVKEKFGIEAEKAEIILDTSDMLNVKIDKTKIYLRGTDTAASERIKAYVEELMLCDAEVYLSDTEK